jgi:hypothetical protein
MKPAAHRKANATRKATAATESRLAHRCACRGLDTVEHMQFLLEAGSKLGQPCRPLRHRRGDQADHDRRAGTDRRDDQDRSDRARYPGSARESLRPATAWCRPRNAMTTGRKKASAIWRTVTIETTRSATTANAVTLSQPIAPGCGFSAASAGARSRGRRSLDRLRTVRSRTKNFAFNNAVAARFHHGGATPSPAQGNRTGFARVFYSLTAAK